MAFGNNRSAARPRASFQVAGGTIVKYRHPFLSGQIAGATTVDEIDVSKSLRLNETFLHATPLQDSAIMEPLVDGSTITITNHLLAGTLTLQVLRTTGLVGTGDFIDALQLVQGSKDDIGGTLTVIENIGGNRIITVFYGVSVKNIPALIKAGNAIVPYPAVLMYAGWVRGISGDTAANEKTIWAVGNKYGLKAQYKPYSIQGAGSDAESPADFYGGDYLQTTVTGIGDGVADSLTSGGLVNNLADVAPSRFSGSGVVLDPSQPDFTK
jgi:hypothetical protein